MKLFEHPDFEQLVLRADEYFRPRGLRTAIIEKDYYVTETLRMIAASKERVIFKGGTSLSKGWNLIDRFSEDVDIFLDPQAFNPELSKRGIDRELKALRDTVTKHPALTFMREESQTIGGFGRTDRLPINSVSAALGRWGTWLWNVTTKRSASNCAMARIRLGPTYWADSMAYAACSRQVEPATFLRPFDPSDVESCHLHVGRIL